MTPSFVKPPVPKPVRTKTGSFIMLEPNSQERLITSPAPPIATAIVATASTATHTETSHTETSTLSTSAGTTNAVSSAQPLTTSTSLSTSSSLLIGWTSQPWDDNSERGSADRAINLDDEDYADEGKFEIGNSI